MFKTITNKEEYELNPKLSTSKIEDVKVELFGKEYFFNKDKWMRNIHLKITDYCNAKCWFCVEKNSNIPQNKEAFLNSLRSLLKQMNDQNSLYTVTITGGEPSTCGYLQDILDEIAKYNVFLTLNTNGRNFPKIKNAPEWINISKHAINDSDLIKLPNLEISDIENVRLNSGSKIRLQAVLTNKTLNDIYKILDFINHYKNIVDDFSFRQIISGKNSINQPNLVEFRKYLFSNAELIEQVFQDYYVYEIWNLNGVQLTLSFSDMEMLIESEKNEEFNMLREIIIHPDGLISGDWNRTTKIIAVPYL